MRLPGNTEKRREEPHAACSSPAILFLLDGGRGSLDVLHDVFRRLVAWAIDALRPGGGFACELHETCLEAAASIVEASGFTGIRIVNDLTGRPRVLVARKSEVS